MKVTINPDEKTATDKDGKVYKIKGLLIKKIQGQDELYLLGTSMCSAIVFKGLFSDAEVEGEEIVLL